VATARHYAGRVIRRILRATRLVVLDGHIPRWLRALAAVGVAPIPGPFDEAVLLLVGAILWIGYRERLHAAWREASVPAADDRVRDERDAGEERAADERRHREG
jgi:hypothetical protein